MRRAKPDAEAAAAWQAQQQQKQSVPAGPCCKTKGPAATSGQPKDQSKAAEAAGLKYWQDKHGADSVSAKLTDFGCHVQVDIVKDNKSIASLQVPEWEHNRTVKRRI